MIDSNIILIGFMGVGKGSLARELSRRTGYYAVDSDDLIESLENRKIKKIFKEKGEPYFRALEQRTAHWLEAYVRNAIISTGGGFFAVENLNRIGRVVFLDADFEAICARILGHPKAAKKIKKRPLLQDMAKAQALFELRRPLYTAKADIIVQTEGRDVEDMAREICQELDIPLVN